MKVFDLKTFQQDDEEIMGKRRRHHIEFPTLKVDIDAVVEQRGECHC